MATRKITTNQLKKIINEVLNEGFYYPISIEAQKKFDEVCLDILYPHIKGPKVDDRPLSKEQFMDTLTKLGEQFYNEHQGRLVNLRWKRDHRSIPYDGL